MKFQVNKSRSFSGRTMGEIPEEDEVSSIFKLLIFVTDAPGANVIDILRP